MVFVGMLAAQTTVGSQVHGKVQPIDCGPLIRVLNKTVAHYTEEIIRRDKVFAATARALSPAAREKCFAKFVLAVASYSPAIDDVIAEDGIKVLLEEARLPNSDAIDRLIECVLAGNQSFCNRALTRITRHQYGAGESLDSHRTSQSRDAIVADWRALTRQRDRRYPIFDAYLAQLCLDAVRALGAGLRGALTPFLPQWDSLPRYLQIRLENDVWMERSGPEIFSWGIGSSSHGAFFSLPANWNEREALAGLRLLLFRPGLPNPSAVSMRGAYKAEEGFPIASSDYREVFGALDLELRFQIVTSNDTVRRAAVDAVRNALAGLRQANAAYR
jgi:hypothetical protein